MTRTDQQRREAERAARRAKRLADRAEQRAERKAQQAQIAAMRAEDLAERAKTNRSPRDAHRDVDKSIEDYVDDVTEKWSKKAESWIDEQSKRLFDEVANHTSTPSHKDDNGTTSDSSGAEDGYDFEHNDSGRDSAEVEARRAQKYAQAARQAAKDAEAFANREAADANSGQVFRRQRSKRRQRKAARRAMKRTGFKQRKRRNRYGNLYRDRANRKLLGVCSGLANYLGVQTWQVRLAAIFGVVFIPSLVIPAYFITYFLLDNKPYYRQMADQYDQRDAAMAPEQDRQDHRDSQDHHDPQWDHEEQQPQARTGATGKFAGTENYSMTNVQALKLARKKFSDIENRLRSMESHVTSPQFELQREFRKISGND